MAITVIFLDAGSGETSHQDQIQKNVPEFHKLYVFVFLMKSPGAGAPTPRAFIDVV